MFLADVVHRETLPVLEKALAFTEARHRVLVENIANVDTPGYRTKHLDAAAFQEALGKALARRTAQHPQRLRVSVQPIQVLSTLELGFG